MITDPPDSSVRMTAT